VSNPESLAALATRRPEKHERPRGNVEVVASLQGSHGRSYELAQKTGVSVPKLDVVLDAVPF
jgi:hypothetical protein